MSHKRNLLDKFAERKATVAVVGLGYVGLPLAVEFAEAGFSVLGLDVDEEKVIKINDCQSYIPDIPHQRLKALVKAGRFRATTCYAELRPVDAISICVPTPLRKTRDPDMSHILEATQSIAQVCKAGMLIVLESTTYPGTTEEIILEGEVPSPIDRPSGCHFHPRCPYVLPVCAQSYPASREVDGNHRVACHLYPDHGGTDTYQAGAGLRART